MKTKVQKGFTLVEVMTATVAGIILLLAAGTVLVIGHRIWNEAWRKVNLQRDASYAMLRISRPIKTATSASVEANGKALRIYTEAGWMRFFFVQGTNDLRYQIKGGPEIIIDGKLGYLEFNVEGNKVTIDLKLTEDNLQTHLVSTVMVRNYGG